MTAGKGLAYSQRGLRAVPDRESPGGPAADRALRTLTPGECLDLLEPGGVGRVGFVSSDGIMMLPVNFAVTGKTIVFRTAPDTLLAVYADGQISFEADRIDETSRSAWSVLVHGQAHKIADEHEVRRLESQVRLEPWASGARDVYVRIVPTKISGRRIGRSQARPAAPGTD